MTRLAHLLVVAMLAVTCGCSGLPRDPDGTLERVQETAVLRVGASPSEGLVEVDGDAVTGTEADIVTAYARSLGAEVRWRVGGEEELVTAMEAGEVDVLIGGLSDTSPWADKVSLTQPYAESADHGERVKHVMAVPLGENAMLVSLEHYLNQLNKHGDPSRARGEGHDGPA